MQADELWSFVYCKEKTRKRLSLPLATHGDMYCFVGMERHNKLALAWHLGNRELESGRQFTAKLAHACWKTPFQITTDGWMNYKRLMAAHFSGCDYGMLIKIFSTGDDASRYSPGQIIEFKNEVSHGEPGRGPHVYFPRRARESDHQDGDEAVHPANEWLLQEV